MSSSIYEQAQAAISELCEKAKLKAGNIVVAGCSTSEVIGSKIGTNSSPEVAAEIFAALHDYTQSKGLYLAVQCCEHLNRAIVVEKAAVPFAETVNVVPQPKAGGSLATQAYAAFEELDPSDEVFAVMIKALDIQKKSSEWTSQSGKFIPGLVRYIKERRWEGIVVEDDIEERILQASKQRLKEGMK